MLSPPGHAHVLRTCDVPNVSCVLSARQYLPWQHQDKTHSGDHARQTTCDVIVPSLSSALVAVFWSSGLLGEALMSKACCRSQIDIDRGDDDAKKQGR